MTSLKQKIRPVLYKLKHQLLTPRNLVVIISGLVALSWVLSAIMAMQQNYNLQKELDKRRQKLAIIKLETEALNFENEYYKAAEYQELAVRQSLGLAGTDEKILMLPPYSQWVKDKQQEQSQIKSEIEPKISNFNQWINFLFGGGRQRR